MFNAFTNKEIQHFLAMLNTCEAEGITDIRFVRQQLQANLDKQYKVSKIAARQHRKVQKIESVICPECKQSLMVPVLNNEGLKILGCKKCRYSEIR